MTGRPNNIVVVGAGVIGLSTAILLQSNLPRRTKITLLAAEFPIDQSPSADYASMWAGAHYRPIPGSSAQLQDEARMAFRTAEIMKTIAREHPEAGIEEMKGIEYLEQPPHDALLLKTGDVYAGPDDEFEILKESELPRGVKWGCSYNAYCANVPMYSKWLLHRFINGGGTILRSKLAHIVDTFQIAEKASHGKVDIVVNCSGRNLDQDPKTKIIRGQTVLVKQQFDKTITRQNSDGSWSFLIPRPKGGGTIVGGSKEIDDLETQVRPETRRLQLQQAVKNFPEFVDSVDKFEIVKDNVGRRPWREGGFRIEIEPLDNHKQIVHGYGAGGRGYELSWGAAERISRLVAENLPTRSQL